MNNYLTREMNKVVKRNEGILSVSLVVSGNRDYSFLFTTIDYLLEVGLNQLILISLFPDTENFRTITQYEQQLMVIENGKGMYYDMFFDTVKVLHNKYPNLPLITCTPIGDAIYYGINRFVKKCAESGISGWDGFAYPNLEDPLLYRKKIEDHGIGNILSVGMQGFDSNNKEHVNMLEKAVATSTGELFFVPVQPGTKERINGLKLKEKVDKIREVQKHSNKKEPIMR